MENVSLTEILAAARDEQSANLHTSITGTIVKFYSEDYTADVRLNVKRWRLNDDGERVFSEYDILPRVRVQVPRGGGYMASFPHAAGDGVLVVFQQASDAEHRTNGTLGEPADGRRHSIGYPVAIPGVFADTNPPGDASARAAGMVVGKVGSDAQIRISSSDIQAGATLAAAVAMGAALEALWNVLAADAAGIDAAITLATSAPPPQPLSAFFTAHALEKLKTTVFKGQ